MKYLKLLALVLITALTIATFPPFTNAQEACVGGVQHATMASGDTLSMCWGIHEDAVVTEYEIYMSQTSGQYDYTGVHTTILASECDSIECRAPLNITALGEYYFTYLATDSKFLRSAPSNEIHLTVRTPLPGGGSPGGGSGCSFLR